MADDPLLIDFTGITNKRTRARLRQLLEDAEIRHEEACGFWERFLETEATAHRPRFLVAADLGRLMRHYESAGALRWRTAVRRARPAFLALLRTRDDGRAARRLDDLLRDSDLRLNLCRNPSGRACAERCLSESVASLEPDSLLEVRFSPGRDLLWVRFSDERSTFLSWSALGLQDLRESLVPEATGVGEGGRTLELATGDGDLFEIDATAIRSLLDRQLARKLSDDATRSDEAVGSRLRSARRSAGLTQTELGKRAQIDQAVISRLERGRHRPRIDTLRRVAHALDLSVAQLLAESPWPRTTLRTYP